MRSTPGRAPPGALARMKLRHQLERSLVGRPREPRPAERRQFHRHPLATFRTPATAIRPAAPSYTKQQRRLGLMLRSRRHVPLDRRMAQKTVAMHRRKLARMTLVKEPNVAFNPIRIRLLGADRVVQHPDARTHLVQQAWRRGCGRCLIGCGDAGDGFHGFFGLITIYV